LADRLLIYLYDQNIPEQFLLQLLEHPSPDVKAYISRKIDNLIKDVLKSDERLDLFIYYAKTILLTPHKNRRSKERLFGIIPNLVLRYKVKSRDFKEMLIELGGSNILKDSESAIVALAKIKYEEEDLCN